MLSFTYICFRTERVVGGCLPVLIRLTGLINLRYWYCLQILTGLV